MKQFRLSGSRINFIAGFLATFITYSGKQLEISLDGRRQQERGLLLAVNNGRYFGGAMKIAPDADPCDGLLDVVVVRDTGKASLLWNFPRVYRGTHINHPNAAACRASQIEVESPQRVLLQVDGELVGEAPARFRLLPGALNVAT